MNRYTVASLLLLCGCSSGVSFNDVELCNRLGKAMDMEHSVCSSTRCCLERTVDGRTTTWFLTFDDLSGALRLLDVQKDLRAFK